MSSNRGGCPSYSQPGSWLALCQRASLAGLAVLGFSLAGCSGEQDTKVLAEPEPVGGPPLVRRLTESQYRATVADIFGSDIPVVARFERGVRDEGLIAVGTSRSGLSPFGMEQYHAAASSVAAEVFSEKHRERLLPCQPETATAFDEACARQFIDQYAPLLLRRPLDNAETQTYLGMAKAGSERLNNFYSGLEYTLMGLMVSPEFLYRIERAEGAEAQALEPGRYELDSYSKAARLSYFLVNSTPDKELLQAASAGELETEEGLQRQVDRLLAAPAFEQSVEAFFRDMLEFDLFDDLTKDSKLFPAFNSAVAADAQQQTLKTITHHLLEEEGDYRDLFTTRTAFLTRALGVVYREPVPTRDGWEKSQFSEYTGRAGIQSHVSFLALHSHPGRSSPTLRGTALREVFLCQKVPDPPANVDFTAVDVDASSSRVLPTARDRLDRHNSEPACAGCHLITDPPAFALEQFDGLGSYRTHENQVLIDTNGSLDGTEFEDASGLALALREHPEVPRCLVEKMYRYAVGRDTVWEERPYIDYLQESFALQGYRVPHLMRTIALSETFFTVQIPAPGGQQYSQTSTEQESRI